MKSENQIKNISSIGISCCGCGNCAIICSKNAISMMYDVEGFLVPFVNQNCVDCGACLKTCPQTKPIELQQKQIAFAAITKDIEVLTRASSGGAFGTIAKHFISKGNAYVCAASYIDGEVRHMIATDIDAVKQCQGSKYVQSNLGNCFSTIKELLRDSINYVLFCGTPCQVNALYAYLHHRPSNLYTLDLVCHGVPSPRFLAYDLKHYDKTGKRLKDVRFRWRNPNKERTTSGFILSIVKSDSTRLYSSSYDPYFSSFMRGVSFRESCYNCHYANLNRVGDITIGDLDSAKHYPDFHAGESKSTIIVNNDHGRFLWNEIKCLFDYISIDLSVEAAANHQLSHPYQRSSVRDNIYKDAYMLSFKQMKLKYAFPMTKQQKVMSFLQSYIPSLYKFIIEKVL